MGSSRFVGLNFGPTIGGISRGPQEKLSETGPYKGPPTDDWPGGPSFEMPIAPYEPVKPFRGSGYIPGKEGAGSSSGGSTGNYKGRPNAGIYVPPQDRGPIWDPKEGFFPGVPPPACDKESQEKIAKAYKDVMSSSNWRNFLTQFPGLLECMQELWRKGVRIACNDSSMMDAGSLTFEADHGRMLFGTESINSPDPTWIQRRMVQQLVWVCGGSKLDAYAISTLQDDVLFKELARNLNILIPPRLPEMNGDRLVWLGKYVFWDPETGEIFSYRDVDTPIIPNPKFSKKKKAKIRKWYILR